MAALPHAASALEKLAHTFYLWLVKSAVKTGQHAKQPSVFDVQNNVVTLDASRASQLIRTGLRAGRVNELVALLGLNKKEDLCHALNVNGTSLWRWEREDKPLPSPSVEQILRAMQLQLFASDVFGGVEDARSWLRKPHPSLDGMTPNAYANNEFGAQKVRGMLAGLKYGGVA